MRSKWFEIKNQAGAEAEVFIFGDIVNTEWEKWDENDTTAKDLIDAIKGMGDFTLRVNSLGGSVPAGNAIYNAMRRHQGKITGVVEGMAASIASVILMACDRVIMPANSMLMIHKPWGWSAGNADDMRKYADTLDKWEQGLVSAYTEKTGMEADEVAQLMADETWMTADEAVKLGFADEIEEPVKIAAKYNPKCLGKFKNVPQSVRDLTQNAAPRHNNGGHGMTFDKLTADHPDIVAQIEAQARQGMVTKEELETAVAAAKQDMVPKAEVEKTVASAKTDAATAERTRIMAIHASCQGSNAGKMFANLVEDGCTEKQANVRIQDALAMASDSLDIQSHHGGQGGAPKAKIDTQDIYNRRREAVAKK